MAKDPAFLFYSNDFLSGTFTMTDEQVGKYIRLLCLQHQKETLTKKDMMNICKTYDKDIFEKFILENGVYYNVRLREVAEKRRAYSDSRRKNRQSEKTYVKHMEIENEIVIENETKSFDFEIIWKSYPKPIGKKQALKHFTASVKSDDDFANIQRALDNYKKSDTVSRGFVQNGSTWFNNWQDWIPKETKPERKLTLAEKDALFGEVAE